jgi:hypothetical protein
MFEANDGLTIKDLCSLLDSLDVMIDDSGMVECGNNSGMSKSFFDGWRRCSHYFLGVEAIQTS